MVNNGDCWGLLECPIDKEHDQVFFVSVQDGENMNEDGGFATNK